MESPSLIFRQWLLPLILAILAMGLGWQLRQTPHTHSMASIGPLTDVSTIKINSDGHTMALTHTKAGWNDSDHPTWKIDSDSIDNWIRQVSSISVTDVKSPQSLEEFGLKSPPMSVRFQSTLGQKTHVEVGKISPSGRVYLRLNGRFVTAAHDQISGIWIKDDHFRDRRPFSALSLTEVRSIRVQGDMRRLGGILGKIQIVKGPATGFWYLLSTRNTIVDTDRVNKLIALVQTMTVSRYIAEPPGQRLTIDVEGRDPFHIEMKLTSDDTAAISLDGSEWGVIYPVLIQGLADIIRHPIGENPLTFDRFFFTSAKLTTSQNSVTLTKNDVGHWIDQERRVGTVPLHNIFVTLQSLQPTRDTSEKGDLIKLSVSSGNFTEYFDITYINSSTIRVHFQSPEGSLLLSGDASALRSQVIKLTAPR